MLCVFTTKEIHWYLRGRYRVLSISHRLALTSSSLSPSSLLNVNEQDQGGCCIDLVCSPDLGTLLAICKVSGESELWTPQKATLFSTPLLPCKRFELQYLSFVYAPLLTHLWDVKKGIREALTLWRSTLRPLDVKFHGLSKLLSDYGVVGTGSGGGGSKSIRLEFLKFILRGQTTILSASSPATSSSSSLASSLDQFFTRMHMHDTLLQKESRMIESCASTTEVILHSRVLGSIRAIVYEAEELYGFASSTPWMGDEEESGTVQVDGSIDHRFASPVAPAAMLVTVRAT